MRRSDVGGWGQDRSMDAPLLALRRHVEALHAAWAGALPALSASSGDAQAEVEQMSDDGLVRVGEHLARVRRDADALLARVAAEVSRRSGPEFGDSGLAKAQGFHNASRLVAASTGGSRHEAARLIAVGRATAYRQAFGGERLPSRHPHVAAALREGDIGARGGICDHRDARPRGRPRGAGSSRHRRVGARGSSHRRCHSTSSCEAFVKPRRDSTKTASNRASRSCGTNVRSRSAKTSTACSTCTRGSTPRTRRP